jgi:hypothetical protein
MNNHIEEDLSNYFAESGLKNIQTFNANEVYKKGQDNFISRVGIWSKVAVSTQMVEEGYISNDDRLKAIEDYDNWVNNEAESMTMVLREVRGSL